MDTEQLILHPQVARQTVDDLAVMVLADSGEVLVLNATGTRVLALIEAGQNAAEITRSIAAEFAVSPEDAGRDVESFLQELKEAGALVNPPPII